MLNINDILEFRPSLHGADLQKCKDIRQNLNSGNKQKTSESFLFWTSTAIVLALLEGRLRLFGTSLISHTYTPERILELSATLLIYVITVLVWEVLADLRSRSAME
jgi:hypothetical protein